MEIRFFSRGFVALALTVGLIAQANAVPQLRLQSSAGANLLITDGDAYDMNPGIGEVTFMGPIAGWSTNVWLTDTGFGPASNAAHVLS